MQRRKESQGKRKSKWEGEGGPSWEASNKVLEPWPELSVAEHQAKHSHP